jgi:hypothetical protein
VEKKKKKKKKNTPQKKNTKKKKKNKKKKKKKGTDGARKILRQNTPKMPIFCAKTRAIFSQIYIRRQK